MKKVFSKAMIFLGALSIIMGTVTAFAGKPSYANVNDLEVIGSELGLELKLEAKPNDTKLFDLKNLYPGATRQAKMDIKNRYTAPFQLSMRVERTSPVPIGEEADLFKQLILTVYLDDAIIHEGQMIDFAPSNVSLGNFNKNSEKELRAQVHLPGPETGNEFQGKTIDVKWIFTAEGGQYSPPDEDGDDDNKDNDPSYNPPDGDSTVIIIPTKPDENKETDNNPPEIKPEEDKEEEKLNDLDKPDDPDRTENPDDMKETEADENKPIMPKTGQLSVGLYYALGSGLLGIGIASRKDKEK